jgi:hypothetical protein
MDVAPPARHFVLEAGDAVDDRHGLSPQTTPRWRSPAMSPSP